MDCTLPGSSVHGIFQARVLEWGAIAFYMATALEICPLRPYQCACNKQASGHKLQIHNNFLFLPIKSAGAYLQFEGLLPDCLVLTWATQWVLSLWWVLCHDLKSLVFGKANSITLNRINQFSLLYRTVVSLFFFYIFIFTLQLSVYLSAFPPRMCDIFKLEIHCL